MFLKMGGWMGGWMVGWMPRYKASLNKEMSLETGMLGAEPINITLRLPSSVCTKLFLS